MGLPLERTAEGAESIAELHACMKCLEELFRFWPTVQQWTQQLAAHALYGHRSRSRTVQPYSVSPKLRTLLMRLTRF